MAAGMPAAEEAGITGSRRAWPRRLRAVFHRRDILRSLPSMPSQPWQALCARLAWGWRRWPHLSFSWRAFVDRLREPLDYPPAAGGFRPARPAAPTEPLGKAASPLPGRGLLVRAGLVMALALTAGFTLGREGAPGLAETGPHILLAHSDPQTRPAPRRYRLADRLPGALEGPTQGFRLTFAQKDPTRLDPAGARRFHPREVEDADGLRAEAPAAASIRPAASRTAMAETGRAAAAEPGRQPPPPGYVEQVLTAVDILDARTLKQGNTTIRLAGIDLPSPGDLCVMVNGRTEPCARRMTTQLELMTRWRQVICRYPEGGAPTDEPRTGTCRIGTMDLAARLHQVVRRAPASDGFVAPIRAASL